VAKTEEVALPFVLYHHV